MAKAARRHHCHAAFQLVVRLDRHRVARHHLAHRSLLRIKPGQQHFYGAVTLGHDTDQYVVVDDQHRPDPVVAHLAQGFDDHVAGTNMDQGATLLGQNVFDCVHRVFSRGPCPSPLNLALSDVPQDLPIVSWVYGQGLFGPQHNSNLYAADLAKLVRFANDDSSPFAWTDASKTQHSALALALRSGTVYQGSPLAIAVGQPDKAELQALLDPHTSTNSPTNFVDPVVYVGQPYAQSINVYWRDDYVLSEANGTMH